MKSGAGDGGSAAEDGRATAASSSSSSKQVPVMIESMPACCDIITDEQVSQSDRANLPDHTRCLGNCPSPAASCHKRALASRTDHFANKIKAVIHLLKLKLVSDSVSVKPPALLEKLKPRFRESGESSCFDVGLACLTSETTKV